jgi:hypothetical protein
MVLYVYNKYKLYSSEKWKVTISLFIGLNALFTGFVLLQQNSIHKEDIANKLSEKYEKLSNDIYYIPLNIVLKTPSLRYLVNDMFMSDKETNEDIYDDNKYQNIRVDINSVSLDEKALFLLICQSISVYAQYYYLHLNLPEYEDLVKSQNVRFRNILSSYLKNDKFRSVVQYYLDYQAGYRTQKYLNEFFNMKNHNPSDLTEKLISENKIIDGKINGIREIN